MKTKYNILAILVLFGISLNLQAERIYVKADASGIENGTSWQNAFSHLQKAIQKAKSGDEIWVSKGIYFPTDGNDKSISFNLKEKVTLYGGFNGTETKLAQRNWELNETILSGNIGDKSDNTDNTTHVVIAANDAILDGFIVEDGYALGGRGQAGAQNMPQSMRQGQGQPSRQGQNITQSQEGQQSQGMGQPQTHTTPQNITQSAGAGAGGGILNFKTCATIRNTIVRNCSAGKGGGVYNMTSTSDRLSTETPSPVFINVKIQGNYAIGRGGGMQNDMGTNPVLINCEFTGNECSAKGGALYNDFGCSPIIINCLFENNKAHDAAAIGNDGSSSPIIIESKIVNNTVESQGAGLYQGSYNANMRGKGNMPLVINSVIKDNKSTTNGMKNTINWGEDWIYAWKSEIESFNYSMDKLDEKYNDLIEIATKIKTLDAETIDKLYAEKVKAYINSNQSKGQNNSGHRGFGTDNILTKTADIPQNIWFVKHGNKNGNGKSWESAFNNLNEAIELVGKNGGGEIWVAVGTYTPTSDQNRTVSFVLKNGVAIYGGFSGVEKSKAERNYEINKTILSGNIGDFNAASDNSFHVVQGSVNSIIDGVTISDGYADGEITNRYGGGLYNWGYESSSIIKNCTFTNNYAEDGGAVFCFTDVLSYFENVDFENNTAMIGGAASFRFGSSCELDNCTFNNNTATSRGGAITINYGSNVIIKNSTFIKNTTTGNGGAIWVDDQASQYGGTKPVITDCNFSNNHAGFYGGAIHNYNIATTVIQDCNFNNNEAKFGKDIANTLRCQVTISNTKNRKADIYNDEGSRVSETAIQNTVKSSSLQQPGIQDKSNGSAQTKNPGDVDFSVTIIGSGNPQYNPERSQPSALVQYKGTTFLVDMGNGTMAHLEELGLTGRNSPDALFLTHHHIDHNAEFIPMVQTELMYGKEFLIAGPSPIDEMVNYTKEFYKEDLNYRMSGRGKTFDENNTKEVVKVLKGGETFEYKGVKISTIEVPHSIKTIAYRFDADGKSIVVTGDLSYSDQLQKLAKDVDVLVIDGKTASNGNGAGRTNQSRPNGNQQNAANESVKAHSSIDEIAKMAAECNAKTMVLTHLSSQPVDEEATSKRYSDLGFKGKIIVAADLLTITPDGDSFISEQISPSNNMVLQRGQNSSYGNLQSENMQNRNGGQSSGRQGNPMARLDTNGDNKISESEAKGPLKENFSSLDTNNDGYITSDELQKRAQRK